MYFSAQWRNILEDVGIWLWETWKIKAGAASNHSTPMTALLSVDEPFWAHSFPLPCILSILTFQVTWLLWLPWQQLLLVSWSIEMLASTSHFIILIVLCHC